MWTIAKQLYVVLLVPLVPLLVSITISENLGDFSRFSSELCLLRLL